MLEEIFSLRGAILLTKFLDPVPHFELDTRTQERHSDENKTKNVKQQVYLPSSESVLVELLPPSEVSNVADLPVVEGTHVGLLYQPEAGGEVVTHRERYNPGPTGTYMSICLAI
jgi:hypothetical protein